MVYPGEALVGNYSNIHDGSLIFYSTVVKIRAGNVAVEYIREWDPMTVFMFISVTDMLLFNLNTCA